MSYDLKYHHLLTALERGDYNDVVRMISGGTFKVDEEIVYYFEDRGRYIVTPLHWAVRHNHPKLCQYLLTHGAEPYRHQVQEYYPLHEACDKDFHEVVQKFIDANCDINFPTTELDTPLHIACMRGHIACVHALLAAGADTAAKNAAGHTPLETALYHGHRDLEELFQVHNPRLITLCMRKERISNSATSSTTASNGNDCDLLGPHRRSCKDTRPETSVGDKLHVPPLLVTQGHFGSTSPSPPCSPCSPCTGSNIKHSQSFHQVSRTCTSSIRHAHSFHQATKSSHTITSSSSQDNGDTTVPSGQVKETMLKPKHWSFSGRRLSPTTAPVHHAGKTHPKYNLYESYSSPEFVLSEVKYKLNDRTKSYDQLLITSSSKYQGQQQQGWNQPVTLSPARERIEEVSRAMLESLESITGSLPPLKHPFVDAFHSLFSQLCPSVGFSEEQFLSLRETTALSPRHKCAHQNMAALIGSPVEYALLGPPLEGEATVTPDGYCTFVFLTYMTPHGCVQEEQSRLKLTLQVFTMGEDSLEKATHYLPTHEAKVLSNLPPHPNIAEAKHIFTGPSRGADIATFVRRCLAPSPDIGCCTYSLATERVEHVFLPAHELTLAMYVANKRLVHPQPPFGLTEEEVLITLIQVLLGLAHLNRHHLLHCTLSPDSIHYYKQRNLFVVGNLDGTVCLCHEDQLRTTLQGLRNKKLSVGPEVHRCVTTAAQNESITTLFGKSDSYAAGKMFYELFHTGSHPLLNWEQPYTEESVPSLSFFSPQLNRILRGLVAYNPTNRIPASEGAFSCLVLLFGPHTSRVHSAEDCHRWMVSESMELYMHPVLKGAREDLMDVKSKLRYMYLAMAEPERVWEACQFLH